MLIGIDFHKRVILNELDEVNAHSTALGRRKQRARSRMIHARRGPTAPRSPLLLLLISPLDLRVDIPHRIINTRGRGRLVLVLPCERGTSAIVEVKLFPQISYCATHTILFFFVFYSPAAITAAPAIRRKYRHRSVGSARLHTVF